LFLAWVVPGKADGIVNTLNTSWNNIVKIRYKARVNLQYKYVWQWSTLYGKIHNFLLGNNNFEYLFRT
jgi:hypothetical protein